MSGPISVEVAREQLRELISILGELRNAGPRDQRFKQWRQITVTLLQRLWPSDPSRAERFRRIPFSAPMGRTDRREAQQYYERGCREASNYLVQLARELGCVVEPLGELPPAYDGEPTPSMEEEDVVDLPHKDAAGREIAADAMDLPDFSVPHEEPVEQSMPVPPEPRKPAAGPRPRLKDMLGFTDESAPDHTRARPEPAFDHPPVSHPAAESQPEVTPPPAHRAPAQPPATDRAPATPTAGTQPAKPVRFKPLLPDEPARPAAGPPPSVEPPPMQVASPSPAAHVEPPPAFEADDDAPDVRRDLAAEFVLESAVLQSRARSAREPEPESTRGATPPDVRDVLELAGRVEELGVPARESAIVRAALIDLARQMESPPVYWGALQETVGFAMHHPELARRILPLVLPYLDRAA